MLEKGETFPEERMGPTRDGNSGELRSQIDKGDIDQTKRNPKGQSDGRRGAGKGGTNLGKARERKKDALHSLG